MPEILPLKSVSNIRDLGGLVGESQRPIRSCLLIRSAALSALSDEDAAHLTDRYGVSHIIDLRTDEERRLGPDRVPVGVSHHAIPLLPEHRLGIAHEAAHLDPLTLARELPDVEHVYRQLVSPEASPRWRAVFDVLLSADTGAVLWHCAGGKDRCGMVAVMVESALGVSSQAVMDDYLASNRAKEARAVEERARIFARTGDAGLAEQVFGLWIARSSYLHAALEMVEETYGGIEGFLDQVCGLDEESRALLRARYLSAVPLS
jgi:protein-tyrosine phosphatase